MLPLDDFKHPPPAPQQSRGEFLDRFRTAKTGGARRDRTDDLLNANQALSQLSYGPVLTASGASGDPALAGFAAPPPDKMVGLGRLERPTSPLSGVRSNHLSYRPRPRMSGNF